MSLTELITAEKYPHLHEMMIPESETCGPALLLGPADVGECPDSAPAKFNFKKHGNEMIKIRKDAPVIRLSEILNDFIYGDDISVEDFLKNQDEIDELNDAFEVISIFIENLGEAGKLEEV